VSGGWQTVRRWLKYANVKTESDKLISRLTKQSSSAGIQPIRKLCDGKVYLFSDDNIYGEIENYHISNGFFKESCDNKLEIDIYTVGHKKGANLFSSVTSSKINRF